MHYIGTLDNGRIFDSRDDAAPLTCTLGGNEIFPALEAQVIGMKVGEVRNITIPAKDAFGIRSDANVIALDRSGFPPGQQIRVGRKIQVDFNDGSSRVMRVVAVDDTSVTLDGNHALAGQDLTFALKLAKILS